MEMWQLLVMVIGVIIALGVGIGGYLKWRDKKVCQKATHRQVSEQNQVILMNHLQHHEGTLEPWMRQMSQDIGTLHGKVDILIKRGD